MRLKLGTRGSTLALIQSNWVADQIRIAHPDIEIEIVRIVTDGDLSQSTNTPLSANSEKGVFAKEIEIALLNSEIDFAVHSMKDLAADLPDGLTIAAIPKREDSRDVIVGKTLGDLPRGARVGTGSARRKALLLELRPDLNLAEIRGNIDTRLAKLDRGDYDAIILAAAGLSRLGRTDVVAEYFDPETFVPDPGQGALAIECRTDHVDATNTIRSINHLESEICVCAERSYLRALGGGCTSPVGAMAIKVGEHRIRLNAMSINSSGLIQRESITGDLKNALDLGKALAQRMLRNETGLR